MDVGLHFLHYCYNLTMYLLLCFKREVITVKSTENTLSFIALRGVTYQLDINACLVENIATNYRQSVCFLLSAFE